MPQTPNAPLEPSSKTPTPPDTASRRIRQVAVVGVLQIRISTIVPSDLDRVARVEFALAIGFAVVLLELAAVLQLHVAGVGDFVGLKSFVQRVGGFALSGKVVTVVVLANELICVMTGWKVECIDSPFLANACTQGHSWAPRASYPCPPRSCRRDQTDQAFQVARQRHHQAACVTPEHP